MTAVTTWDIFCRVVDNYGDVGVCWRLARQLASEHGAAVRLWVDRLDSLHRICPDIDPALEVQRARDVNVRRWAEPWRDAQPAAIVVEAFACHVPDRYTAAMAARTPKPVWINLEYLSAQEWVVGCHGLASPHPTLPLTKYFFFPGFGANTGGLLREADLCERRRTFRADVSAQARFWHSLRVPAAEPGEFRLSLFSYPDAAFMPLLDAWSGADRPVACIVPQVPLLLDALRAALGVCALEPGTACRRGNLALHVVPFLEQDCYDRLLWASECNFVRGEDSFVRAQWAARPFVWHIYGQQEDAHWPKLDAFLDLYRAGLTDAAAASLRGLWETWNRGQCSGADWRQWLQHFEALENHAEAWAGRLATETDLARNLVEFARSKIAA